MWSNFDIFYPPVRPVPSKYFLFTTTQTSHALHTWKCHINQSETVWGFPACMQLMVQGSTKTTSFSALDGFCSFVQSNTGWKCRKITAKSASSSRHMPISWLEGKYKLTSLIPSINVASVASAQDKIMPNILNGFFFCYMFPFLNHQDEIEIQ